MRSQYEIHQEVPYFEHENLVPYLEKETGKSYVFKPSISKKDIKDKLDSGDPLLLRLDGEHTVIVMGYNGDTVNIIDPDKGTDTMRFSDVSKRMTGIVYRDDHVKKDGTPKKPKKTNPQISIPYYGSQTNPTEAILQSLLEYYNVKMSVDEIHTGLKKEGDVTFLLIESTDRNFDELDDLNVEEIKELIDDNIPVLMRTDDNTILITGYTSKSFVYHDPLTGPNQTMSKTGLILKSVSSIYEFIENPLTEESGKELDEVLEEMGYNA